MDTVKMVFYLGVIMFAIFHETHTTDAMLDKDFWIRHSEVWIRIELIIFFIQILCSTIFLMGVQINGEMGRNNDPNFQRYKNDTLRYYNEDIAWFSYMFVCLCLHCWMIQKYSIKPSTTDQGLKYAYSIYMIVFSLIRLVLLMPYRASDRTFIEFSNIKWIILFVMEIVGAVFFLFFKRIKGSNTFSCCMIDSICLIGMFLLYKINEAASAKPEEIKQPLLKCINVSPASS
jgi:cytochrome bd-type quinol oxidase subunit 2